MTLSRVVKTMETATAKTAGDGAVDSWLPYHPDTKEILHGNVLTCGAKYRGRRALRFHNQVWQHLAFCVMIII